jgi:hypothetical protein
MSDRHDLRRYFLHFDVIKGRLGDILASVSGPGIPDRIKERVESAARVALETVTDLKKACSDE